MKKALTERDANIHTRKHTQTNPQTVLITIHCVTASAQCNNKIGSQNNNEICNISKYFNML